MQRAWAVVSQEVGDVDQSVDRPQADRGQALLQPLRRWAILYAAHEPQREARTQACVLDGYLHRARKFGLGRLDRGVLEVAHVDGGKVARDAMHAGAVLPVGREIDL